MARLCPGSDLLPPFWGLRRWSNVAFLGGDVGEPGSGDSLDALLGAGGWGREGTAFLTSFVPTDCGLCAHLPRGGEGGSYLTLSHSTVTFWGASLTPLVSNVAWTPRAPPPLLLAHHQTADPRTYSEYSGLPAAHLGIKISQSDTKKFVGNQ